MKWTKKEETIIEHYDSSNRFYLLDCYWQLYLVGVIKEGK